MAFQRPKNQPQFADLKGILAQAKQIDNPLYQVLSLLIDRLVQTTNVTEEKVADVKRQVNEVTTITFEGPVVPHAPTHSDGGIDPVTITSLAGFPGGILLFLREDRTFAAIPFVTPPANSIPETAIIDGVLLARVADNETISGSWTYTAGATPITLSSAGPALRFNDTDGGADMKRWRIIADSNVFAIQTFTDADAPGSNYLLLTRTGTTPLLASFFSNFLVSQGLYYTGRSNVNVTADQTAWNPTGLGTVHLIIATPTGVTRTINGITAQSDGYEFTLLNGDSTGGITLTIAHENGAASGANRIFSYPTGMSLAPGNSCVLHYDGGFSRWRIVSFKI